MYDWTRVERKVGWVIVGSWGHRDSWSSSRVKRFVYGAEAGSGHFQKFDECVPSFLGAEEGGK
jgi:hypothetical protein